MNLYVQIGGALAPATTPTVAGPGGSVSPATLVRQVEGGKYTRAQLAACSPALYLDFVQPEIWPGDGWLPAVVGVQPDGQPCALIAPVALTPQEVHDRLRGRIDEEGERLLLAAAKGYGWPESACWLSLEAQSRAWLGVAEAPEPELRALVGETATVAEIVAAAQSEYAAYQAAVEEAAAAEQPAPEQWPAAAEAVAYLAAVGNVGVDLREETANWADPLSVETRARSVVSKADSFRATRGAIVRWRRDVRDALAAGLEAGADRATMEGIVVTALALAPRT